MANSTETSARATGAERGFLIEVAVELASHHVEELRPIYRAHAAYAARVSPDELSTWHSAYGLLPVRDPRFRRVYTLADVLAIRLVGDLRERAVALSAALAIANDLRRETIPNIVSGGPPLIAFARERDRWAFEAVPDVPAAQLRVVNIFRAGYVFLIDFEPIVLDVIDRLTEAQA
ncbi:hypothetical protein A3731_00720 [Roseovarius sp. HI0049]|nr:hypothetical protein A3731_00720 [Roseovarius sp. HI0049]